MVFIWYRLVSHSTQLHCMMMIHTREVEQLKNDAVQNIKSEFKIIPVCSEIVSEPPNNNDGY